MTRSTCTCLQLTRARVRPQVLLSLLSVKVPITDADLIRALACRALVGLSRSGTVRQIISRLPLLTSGHIQQVRSVHLVR